MSPSCSLKSSAWPSLNLVDLHLVALQLAVHAPGDDRVVAAGDRREPARVFTDRIDDGHILPPGAAHPASRRHPATETCLEVCSRRKTDTCGSRRICFWRGRLDQVRISLRGLSAILRRPRTGKVDRSVLGDAVTSRTDRPRT